MNKLKSFYQTHKYIWIPIIYSILYMPWYFGIQLRDLTNFHQISIQIDRKIPFIPSFVYIYIYWFLFVGYTIVVIFLYDKNEFIKASIMLCGGMTVALLIFTFYPTTFNYRPSIITGNHVEKFLLSVIYHVDTPTNVFPSIHVYNSIACAMILIKSKAFINKSIVKLISILSAILITLSTMFIKQHSILDALLASILAIIFYYCVYHLIDKRLKL